MDEIRFEFRVFGTSLRSEQQRMATLSDAVPAELHRRISHEYYLIPRKANRYNVKIRNGMIDIKYLLQTVDGFEQWQPHFKTDFPLNIKDLKNEVFPALNVDPFSDIRETFSMRQLLDMLETQQSVCVIKVKKIRRSYTVRQVICEFASLNLQKIRTTTISAESHDIAQLHKVVDEIGINKYKNTNYIQAIRDILHI